MPFVAIRTDKNTRVYIGEYSEPKSFLYGLEFVCQDCGMPMHIRAGDFVRPHFAHMPGRDERPCFYKSTGESEMHLLAKFMIAEQLAAHRSYRDAVIEVEYPIDTTTGRRYIDVYM